MTFRRHPDIEAAPLDNELMLFSAATKKFVVLNATAGRLWECLEQPRTTDQLAQALRVRFKTNGAAVEQDVASVIAQFEELGLVVRENLA